MSVLRRSGHPRKKDWWCYICNCCGDQFWGPPPYGKQIIPGGKHYCYGCNRGGPVHFANAINWPHHDDVYHGNRNYSGE